MGARVIVRRDPGPAKNQENRAIVLILAAVVGPLLLTYLLIAADMRSELSELKPRQATTEDGTALVSWRDLDTSDHAGRPRKAVLPTGPVRMLGYMMDGYHPVRDGTYVKMFVLMPEAGQLLHPAHRLRDEMVEVWLAGGQSIPYMDRNLVWVEGKLQRIRQKARDGLASYAIREAAIERAPDRDIMRWFAP